VHGNAQAAQHTVFLSLLLMGTKTFRDEHSLMQWMQ
jgi:hypothetical protein